MSFSEVSEYLKKNGASDGIIEFDESSATVDLAVERIGCSKEQIAKSVSVILDGKGALMVCSGDMKLDNKKYKACFGEKVTMVSHDSLKEMIGHDIGGVCPFCLNDGVNVFFDESLKRCNIVYPAAGSENSVVKLTLGQLESLSHFERWVDVCKPR